MKSLILALTVLLSGLAHASTIVCEGTVDFYGEIQKFKVTINGDGIGQAYDKSTVRKIEVSGASLTKPNVFTHADDYWDGHSSGLISAPGFSMSYDNTYGCMRNVVITTDFRGDVKNEGQTVGHITQSKVIPLCNTGNSTCSN